MEDLEAEILYKLGRKYDDYKFYRHDSYRDFIQKKGWLRRKPTGVIIKAKDMNWKRESWKAKEQFLFCRVYNVSATIYYHVDKENKIILYRFV